MLKPKLIKLTSNSNVNKLLLNNASIADMLSALHDENLRHAVTKEDIRYVVYDILKLDKQLDSLDTIAKIQLIGLGEMIEQFANDDDLDIRFALTCRRIDEQS